MNLAIFVSPLPDSELLASASASERHVTVGDLKDITLSIAAQIPVPYISDAPGGVMMGIGVDYDISMHSDRRASAGSILPGYGFKVQLSRHKSAEAIGLSADDDVRTPCALTSIVCVTDDCSAFFVSCLRDREAA